MARKNIDKRLESVSVKATKLVQKMQELKASGEQGTEAFRKLGTEANKTLTELGKLSQSVKNSFAQTKNVEQFEKRIKSLEREFGRVEKIAKKSNKVIADDEKKSLKRREDIQKRWDNRRKKREREAAQAEVKLTKEKERVEKEALKRRERVQKAWDDRRRKRQKQARIEAEKAAKQRDFVGGLRAQFTPRAIGGAIGSLTKYLGIYQAIQLAQTAFNKAIIDSVKISIEFEKELANLGAVAGATESEVSQLKDAALATAGTTTFTASEIVKLQVALSKLGFEAGQVATATKSIALTAQALGEPLDKTATLVGKVINQFGLLAEESGLVADTLVTTINNSALSLESFGTAIQYVGPLAAELGFNFEQTAAAMAILSDNGFTASRVGTGLRGIFTELGKTSADVSREIEILAERNLSLSEAVDLVGKRNAAQLLTLTRNVDALKDSNSEYYQQGRAIESAAKQIDTYNGQLQLLKSRYNEIQIGIGDAILQTKAFENVLRFLSPRVAETVAGFKAFREVGTEKFNESVKDITEGADTYQTAVSLLAKNSSKFQDDFKRLENSIAIGTTTFDEYGNVISQVDFMDTINPEALEMLQGYIDLLDEATISEIERQAAQDGRDAIDIAFKDRVEALTEAQRKGVDITKDVNAEAERAQIMLDSYNSALEDTTDLTNEDIILIKAQKEQTQLYLNILSNLLGVQKTINEENEKTQEKRKFDMSYYEAQIKNLDEQYERLKRLNELRGDEVQSGNALLIINKSKVEAYNELLSRIDATKKSIQAEISATDQSTEAGRKKVKVHKQEIAQFDKLTKKYTDQRDGLIENLDVLDQIFAQGSKDLNVAAKMDATPEIKLAEQNRIIKQLEAQLLEAAGDDEQLQEIARAYIGSLYTNMETESSDRAKDFKEQQRKLLSDIAKYAAEAADSYNQTALENKKAALDAELEEIKNKYEVEDYLAKQQLENNLINEGQYRRKQSQLRKAQVEEENRIAKEKFEAEKKADSANVITETLEAIASNAIQNYTKADSVSATAMTAAGYVAIVASGAAKLDAINRRKFYPVKFEEGGIVNGPSHAQGGIPFTVQGQGGFEMEGGEFIVNKKAASLHRELLESINNSVKPTAVVQPMKFAQGGIVNNSITNVSAQAEESVNYLKAIAEATTTNAINSAKPVRAFVTSSDLRRDETSRRIKDNNTTI